MKKLIILFLVTSINIAFFTTYAQDCESTTITKVEQEDSGNRITWTQPTVSSETMISQGGDLGTWCTGNTRDFAVFHRFRPEDLSTVNLSTLTQVVFAPSFLFPIQTGPGHTFTIQIYNGGVWEELGGNRNPGTLISSQDLDNNILLFNKENSITLEKPITIDASQELWIGYFCTNIDSIQSEWKCSAGVDKEIPRKEGLGNIMFTFDEWLTLYEAGGSAHEYNWCLKGTVQTIDGLTVNIFHNNYPIDTEISGTTYFHSNPTGEEHCYKVEVNCLEGGVSILSNELCIEWNNINEQNHNFNIYPNPAYNELRITNYELRDGVVEIYDVYGRKINSKFNPELNSGQNSEFVIDISSLSPGIYFIKLTDVQGSSVNKFIKE